MSEKKEIKIGAAKGRPMLSWVGKRPLRSVTAFPAQHVETFAAEEKKPEDAKTPEGWKDWPTDYPHGGLLFHGDNKEVLGHLLANGFRGMVKLIYIDPPFDSGADYVRKVQLRGVEGSKTIDGESYVLGEQIQYSDIWANDNYLQFMYERLILLKELLHKDGSILLHCDWHRSHVLRCMLDEVFGAENLQNEIIWQRTDPHNDAKSKLGWVHDVIMWYRKGENFTYNWEEVVEPLSPAALKEYSLIKLINGSIQSYSKELDGKGRRFKLDDCTWKGNDPSRRFEWRGAKPSNKRVWPYDLEGMERALINGDFYLRDQNQGAARCRVSFLDEREGQVLQTIWTECGRMKGGSDYPTQKPWALLARIVQAFSNPSDLVLDCFTGSGTTVAVAQKLGRRWIGCDINKGATQATAKRLKKIVDEQAVALQKLPMRLPGIECDGDASPLPAQLSFGVWRVNDYDLNIQRNEAIKLACEHVGVERLASDSFFDGKLGKKLVKIVPFEHPLSPLDLEELKRELEARPELENTIVFVCLGIELAARTWVDDWNRMRKGKETVNKIEVIELRTDAKYGNFIKHEPATAKVAITRIGDKIAVKIEDFISPTILKRLDIALPLFKAKITDWRSQVDCIMIDTAYDGAVFNVVLSDVPEKKNDLIEGAYTLPAPTGMTTVAVKIIDMLGEEVLVLKKV
jgi:DNA modification methylase